MAKRQVFTLLWKIENFLPFDCDLDQLTIPCPDFYSRSFQGKPFHVQVCIRGQSRKDDRLRVMFSWRGKPVPHRMSCDMTVLGENGLRLATGSFPNMRWQRYDMFQLHDSPRLSRVFSWKSLYLPNDTLTVRCRVWGGGRTMCETVSCRTVIDTAVHEFLWPVVNFSGLQLDEEVISPVSLDFATGKSMGCYDNFYMKFAFKGTTLEESESDLELTGMNLLKDMKVHVDVSVLDDELRVVKSLWNERRVFRTRSEDALVLSHLFTRKEVMAEPSVYLRGDVLTLCSKITAYMFSCFVDRQESGLVFLHDETLVNVSTSQDASTQTSGQSFASDTSFHVKESLNSLIQDFRRMYQEGHMSDFQVRVEDETYPVHRALLCARSPVFSAALSGPTGPGYVHVRETDPPTLKRMLLYLYTGTLDPIERWEDAADLYRAAAEYRVQTLKDLCSFVLRSLVTVSSMGRALKFAESHQDADLGSFLCGLFVERFDDVVDSVEWREFMQSDSTFAGEVMLQAYQAKRQGRTYFQNSDLRPETYSLL